MPINSARAPVLDTGQSRSIVKIGITGHQSIPGEAIEFIRAGIRSTLRTFDKPIGLSSLAAGADQIFARELLHRGGALIAVLPCRRYELSFSDNQGLEQFRELLGRATSVKALDFSEPSEEAYLAAGEYIVNESDQLIAVWDGRPPRGKGGTADIVAYANRQRRKVVLVWPPGIDR